MINIINILINLYILHCALNAQSSFLASFQRLSIELLEHVWRAAIIPLSQLSWLFLIIQSTDRNLPVARQTSINRATLEARFDKHPPPADVVYAVIREHVSIKQTFQERNFGQTISYVRYSALDA